MAAPRCDKTPYVIKTLCGAGGRKAKKGLGGHEKKGKEGRRCGYRAFRGAGRWSDERTLYGGDGLVVRFRPRTVQCVGCGKRFTPILDALELGERRRSRRRAIVEGAISWRFSARCRSPSQRRIGWWLMWRSRLPRVKRERFWEEYNRAELSVAFDQELQRLGGSPDQFDEGLLVGEILTCNLIYAVAGTQGRAGGRRVEP